MPTRMKPACWRCGCWIPFGLPESAGPISAGANSCAIWRNCHGRPMQSCITGICPGTNLTGTRWRCPRHALAGQPEYGCCSKRATSQASRPTTAPERLRDAPFPHLGGGASSTTGQSAVAAFPHGLSWAGCWTTVRSIAGAAPLPTMSCDEIDLPAVIGALTDAELPPVGQLTDAQRGNLLAVPAKADPATTENIRGARH